MLEEKAGGEFDGLSMTQFLAARNMFDLRCIFLSQRWASDIVRFRLRSRWDVPLLKRIEQHCFVHNHPPLASLRRWRGEGVLAVPEEEEEEAGGCQPWAQHLDPVLRLPKKCHARLFDEAFWREGARRQGLRRRHDPVKVVQALGFSQFLRSAASFHDALQHATEYDRDIVEADAQGEVVRNTVADPRTTMLKVAHARLDAVAMLLMTTRWKLSTCTPMHRPLLAPSCKA